MSHAPSTLISGFGFLAILFVAAGNAQAQQGIGQSFRPDRFEPPAINKDSNDFVRRAERGLFNADFVTANVLGKANKIAREVTESANQTANSVTDQVITSQNGSNQGPATAGSIVVQPGVSVDDLYIINMIEGDAIAIDR